jgi:hypothetical protein
MLRGGVLGCCTAGHDFLLQTHISLTSQPCAFLFLLKKQAVAIFGGMLFA